MDVLVGKTFLDCTVKQREHLKKTVRDYITYPTFLNIIDSIDVHDQRGTQISQQCLKLGAYNGLVNLWSQIEEWLKNGQTGSP
jgi:hypothetical protein